MKPAGHLLLFPAALAAGSLWAQPAPGLVSREITAHIREGLPTYKKSPPATDEAPDRAEPQTRDPTVLILPKLTVHEKRLPPDAADQLMSRRDFKRKMENLYADTVAELGPLNVLLNSLTISLLSPSKAARGRAIYRGREIERLRHVRGISPDEGKPFDQELDNTWTTRPAGGR